MNYGARRILRMLRETGPRKPGVLKGLVVRPGDPARAVAEFEQAIGQLFLGGYIMTTGRTSGKMVAVNGRRSA